ncbi:MAG: monovalent cation/H(+) antiporter subunit G [Alphaproteobacteria bacterium]
MMLSMIIGAAAEGAAHTGSHIPWGDVFEFFQGALALVSMLAGLFFVLAGTIGVLRLPDFFTRVHAAGMTDTLGAELIIVGLMIQAGFTQLSLKFLLVAMLLLVTSPTATHAVANAAHHVGLKPLLGKYKIPDPSEETTK